jgi:hypothetical protein
MAPAISKAWMQAYLILHSRKPFGVSRIKGITDVDLVTA